MLMKKCEENITHTFNLFCFSWRDLTSPDSPPTFWLASKLAAPASHILSPSSLWEHSDFCCCTTYAKQIRQEGRQNWWKWKLCEKLALIKINIFKSFWKSTIFIKCTFSPQHCCVVHTLPSSEQIVSRVHTFAHKHTQADTNTKQIIFAQTGLVNKKEKPHKCFGFFLLLFFLSPLHTLMRQEEKNSKA